MQVAVQDVSFRSTLPQRTQPSQLNRMQPLLHDPPAKLGLKVAHADPPPLSMFVGE